MFRNLKKEKELIDREIQLYKDEKMLEADVEVETYRFKVQSKIQDLAKRCHEELGQYEHNYHYTKEVKGIELAKLETKLEFLKEVDKSRDDVVSANNKLLEVKDSEIKRLNDIITLLINKQPTSIHQIKK